MTSLEKARVTSLADDAFWGAVSGSGGWLFDSISSVFRLGDERSSMFVEGFL